MWLVIILLTVMPASLICWLLTIIYSFFSGERVMISPLRWMVAILGPVTGVTMGVKNKHLDRSGAIAGLLVGFILTISNLCFSVSLLTLFITLNKIAKYKLKTKERVKDNGQEGGQRNWIEVLCNSGIAALFAVQYMLQIGCAENPVDFAKQYGSSWLVMSVLGALSCACGDTFSSVIGTTFKKNSYPRLITTFNKVPEGTNGAITLMGVLGSILGGALISASYYLCQLFFIREIYITDSPPQWPIVLVGMVAGFLGSSIDSVLGSIFQYSGYDHKRKCIVEHSGTDIEYISGMELLDNHSVNMLSSLIASLLTPKVAFEIWRHFT